VATGPEPTTETTIRQDLQRIDAIEPSSGTPDPSRKTANPDRSYGPDDPRDESIDCVRALALARAAFALIDVDLPRVRGLLADLVELLAAPAKARLVG
jgi:hypothetical protein